MSSVSIHPPLCCRGAPHKCLAAPSGPGIAVVRCPTAVLRACSPHFCPAPSRGGANGHRTRPAQKGRHLVRSGCLIGCRRYPERTAGEISADVAMTTRVPEGGPRDESRGGRERRRPNSDADDADSAAGPPLVCAASWALACEGGKGSLLLCPPAVGAPICPLYRTAATHTGRSTETKLREEPAVLLSRLSSSETHPCPVRRPAARRLRRNRTFPHDAAAPDARRDVSVLGL